ncbi:MAG: hypothetical protein Q7T03_05400 [Deltaproteobacteria bacterium]|nr:hypothetical protein [Deltaproteobacteria bacterium]
MDEENKIRLLPQLRYAYGYSALLKQDESEERFGYDTHSVQGALIYPYGNWASGYVSVAGRFAHADETSLGSRRTLAGLEGGGRFFVPRPFLNLFALELGVGAGVGQSALNFGGGNIPEAAFDSQVVFNGKILFQYRGFDLGAGMIYGSSTSRNYGEWGGMATLSVPLRAATGVDVQDGCRELAQVEYEIGLEEKKFSTIKAGAFELWSRGNDLVRTNALLRDQQTRRRDYLEKSGFKCDAIPDVSSFSPFPKFNPPERPQRGECLETLSKAKVYLAELRGILGLYSPKNLIRDVRKEQKLNVALSEWDLKCLGKDPHRRMNIVTVKKSDKVFRLLTNYLFSNDSPDLTLMPQWNLGQPAGFADPYLDEWIRFMAENPKYAIAIDGYASDRYDAVGYDETAMIKLAQERADSIAGYLQKRGSAGFIYEAKDRRKFPIATIFVASTTSRPLEANRILKVTGHGKEAVDDFKISSNPAFRMVKISVFKNRAKKGTAPEWVEVDLKN